MFKGDGGSMLQLAPTVLSSLNSVRSGQAGEFLLFFHLSYFLISNLIFFDLVKQVTIYTKLSFVSCHIVTNLNLNCLVWSNR